MNIERARSSIVHSFTGEIRPPEKAKIRAVDKKITKRLTRRSLRSKKGSPFFYL
jgi:hypothetical protein